jgi:dihydroorotase
LPEDKKGGALKAASGMPSIQFSLLAMLDMVDKKEMSIETLVEKMCHAPARIFNVSKRGYIEKGFNADFVLLSPNRPHTVTAADIISKCGWSPFEGTTFNWAVEQTWVNGECVYRNGRINEDVRGKALKFNR